MKRSDWRKVGKQFADYVVEASTFVQSKRGAVWYPDHEGVEFGEPCKCVGVMVLLDDEGFPVGPGFVLESLDGRRLYTTPAVRIEAAADVQ